MTRGGTILLVEDEADIASLVRAYLERDGFRVVWATRGTEGLQALEQHDVRLAILDLQLPDTDGFDVCRAIRACSRLPVVMLTARDEEIDRVTGLELGADDYVTKPFSPRELVARVHAVLRRAEPEREHDTLVAGDVVLDRRSRTAIVAGADVELTLARVRARLAPRGTPGRRRQPRAHPRARLGARRSPAARERSTSTSASCAGSSTVPTLIRTVRGSGYKLVASVSLRSRLFLGIAGTVLVSLVVTVVAGRAPHAALARAVRRRRRSSARSS